MSTLGVLDRLGTVAPVLAVRSATDPPADGDRLREGPLLIRAGSTLIGMVADLPDVTDPAGVFGTDVDLALTGTSHVPLVARVGPAMVVNPGSPTLPTATGPTLALLDLAGTQTTRAPRAPSPKDNMTDNALSIVGLVADTHCTAADGGDLPESVVAALRGCGLVVHLGDLTSLGVLDRLAETGAEVIAIRNPDLDLPVGTDARLVDGPVQREVQGRRVVLMRALPISGEAANVDADVVAYGVPEDGGGHDHRVAVINGALVVTPGSPTYPARHSTVARLTFGPDTTEAEIVHLG